MTNPRFPLGRILATPGALAALEQAGQNPAHYLARHHAGDWGDLDPEDVQENEFSLDRHLRLHPAHRDRNPGCFLSTALVAAPATSQRRRGARAIPRHWGFESFEGRMTITSYPSSLASGGMGRIRQIHKAALYQVTS